MAVKFLTLIGAVCGSLKAATTHMRNAEKMQRPQDAVASLLLADERIREAWLANRKHMSTLQHRHQVAVPEYFWEPLDDDLKPKTDEAESIGH